MQNIIFVSWQKVFFLYLFNVVYCDEKDTDLSGNMSSHFLSSNYSIAIVHMRIKGIEDKSAYWQYGTGVDTVMGHRIDLLSQSSSAIIST